MLTVTGAAWVGVEVGLGAGVVDPELGVAAVEPQPMM